MRLGGHGHGGDHSIATMSRRLFDKMDENRNGSASIEEFQRSGVLRKLGVVKTADEEKAAFAGADTNHDGALSRMESQVFFQQVLTQSEKARIAAMLMLMQEDDAEAAKDPAPAEPAAEAAPEEAPPPEASVTDPAESDQSQGRDALARGAEARLAKAYAELAKRTAAALATAPTHGVTT